jgi:adenosylcobyric acid synthase
VALSFVSLDAPLPLDAQLVVLPGSKSTASDLESLRAQGWHHDLHAYVRRGGRVLGICAGYQMLGQRVSDPDGVDGAVRDVRGLGLLDVETVMTPSKTLREVTGVEASTGARIHGYEMHLGASTGPGTSHPMVRFDDGSCDGATGTGGRVSGCHIHGLFHSTEYRSALLASIGGRSAGNDHAAHIDAALDEIAAALEKAVEVEAVLKIGEKGDVNATTSPAAS